ncbi:MAG TPA: hypothetical protein VN711_04405 [Candidatus Saccharimonadales bacterium]|nr:hypothetical protein [Candidatus Saccharimonadales bacterium]
MKRQMNGNEIVTKDFLAERLDKLKDEMIEAFREYRDQILGRMDKDVSELEQIRENQVFLSRDVKDPEKRITKLELSPKAA